MLFKRFLFSSGYPLKNLVSLFLLVLVFLISTNANADLIVDTGTMPTGPQIGLSLTEYQWLAAEFTTAQDYFVNEILGWIDSDSGGTATATIYADDFVGVDSRSDPATSELPGTELFSQAFTASAGKDWFGPQGLNWNLSAGTYWVAFEVHSGQTLDGAMRYGAPNPLQNQASCSGSLRDWRMPLTTTDYKTYGVRIDAKPVPEPTSMLLFGAGLACLRVFRKKLKRA